MEKYEAIFIKMSLTIFVYNDKINYRVQSMKSIDYKSSILWYFNREAWNQRFKNGCLF